MNIKLQTNIIGNIFSCSSVVEERLTKEGTVLYKIIWFQVILPLHGPKRELQLLAQSPSANIWLYITDHRDKARLIGFLPLSEDRGTVYPASKTSATTLAAATTTTTTTTNTTSTTTAGTTTTTMTTTGNYRSFCSACSLHSH